MLSSCHWLFPSNALWVGVFIQRKLWVRSHKGKSWEWNPSASCHTGQIVTVQWELGFEECQMHSALALPQFWSSEKGWFWLFFISVHFAFKEDRFWRTLITSPLWKFEVPVWYKLFQLWIRKFLSMYTVLARFVR